MPTLMRVRHRLFGAALVLVVSVPIQSMHAQARPMTRDEAIAQSGLFFEGPNSIPKDVAARVLADSGALQLYDDLLNGRQPWVAVADSATMLRWLALSEQPRFLPTLLHFANPDLPTRKADVFGYASAGLTRLAALPAARERLLALGRPTVRRDYREQLVRILAFRNSVAARDVLRAVTTDDLSPSIRRRASNTLAAPAAP